MTNNEKHHYTYLDNSVISSLKRNKTGEQVSFTRFTLNPYLTSKILITPKILAEFLSGGQLKKTIYDKEKQVSETVNELTKKILDKTLSNEDLENIHSRLYRIFSQEFQDILPQEELHVRTTKEINTYPFMEEYKFVGTEILKYAKSLSLDYQSYTFFIDSLASNATISFMMNPFHPQRPSKKDYSTFDESIDKITSFLLHKHISSLWTSNFMLIIAAIQSKATNQQEKAEENLLYAQKDLADSEHQYLFFFGIKNEGVQHPVNIFVSEPVAVVEKRLAYYWRSILEVKKRELNNFNKLSEFSHERSSESTMIVIESKKITLLKHPSASCEKELLFIRDIIAYSATPPSALPILDETSID